MNDKIEPVQPKRVWVYLTNEQIRDLNREGVVELKNTTPKLLGKVWGFKEKPQNV
jgi:hypothetical protein